MKDAATMSITELEGELRAANDKLMEARETGNRTGELEARIWRLLFEKRYRQTKGQANAN